MSRSQWVFEAVDTLFFRDSRPMESVGGSELASGFPPPARTLIGAIRTAIGDALGVDWQAYGAAEPGQHPVHAVMGTPGELGPLRFTGPWIARSGERLFPMPRNLLFKDDDAVRTAELLQTVLRPGAPAHCDLGVVRLPAKARPLDGAKPLEDEFLTADGLHAYLQGKPVLRAQVVRRRELFEREGRLGIALDHDRRTTGDGLLYQTEHVRPTAAQGLEMGITLEGLDRAGLPAAGMARLGAEGRMAHWRCDAARPLPPAAVGPGAGVLLLLLGPARFAQGWLPDGFAPLTDALGVRQWRGRLHGVELLLHCAVVGRPQREGGWDMAGGRPRELDNLVPAGSLYFCSAVDGDAAGAAAALHGRQIGMDTEWGRGELAVGGWTPA